jgi:hypothetical protein
MWALSRVRVLGLGITLAVLGLVPVAFSSSAAVAATPRNVYTPVLAQLLSPNNPAPVLGTDRENHVLYELRLSNRGPIPATIQQVTVVDADTRLPVHTYSGDDLLERVRDTGGVAAPDAVIEPGGERLFLVDLSFDLSANVPLVLEHRLDLLAAKSPRATQPTAVSYTILPISVDGPAPPVLVAPVRGNGWVVTDGCCNVGSADRGTILPVNGGLWSPLRYNVDLMQLDDNGLFVHDDPTQLTNFTSYGADVLAVAPGRVAAVVDALPDQPVGGSPDAGGSGFESAGGNYIVIDLGNGSYAYYGNLQPGSLLVKPGDRVQRRQVLATIGNSGDSVYPHLEFRLMSSPSPFGSDGLPFVLNGFSYEGNVDVVRFVTDGVFGNYLDNRQATPIPRRRELPLALAIVDFGAAGGAGAAGRT